MNGIVSKFLTQVKGGGIIELEDLEEDCQQNNRSYFTEKNKERIERKLNQIAGRQSK